MDSERISWLLSRLEHYALTEQIVDITLRSSKPKINIKINPKFSYALMHGAWTKGLKPLLDRLELSDGTHINAADIWTINPMPSEGFTQEELSSVDINEGNQIISNMGKTMKEIIAETYKCENEQETEYYLRRFIAS